MGKWLAFTFALTGRREWGHGTQGVALALDLLGFQPAQGRRQGFFRTISTYLIFNFEHPTIKDLGKKWFGFSKMEILTPNELVERINRG